MASPPFEVNANAHRKQIFQASAALSFLRNFEHALGLHFCKPNIMGLWVVLLFIVFVQSQDECPDVSPDGSWYTQKNIQI
jgi:hypothetical protein